MENNYRKNCNRCKENKDASYFTRDRRAKDGLLNTCKECYKIYREKYYQNIEPVVSDEKKCLSCKEVKSISNFYKEKYSKDKLKYYCKECRRKFYEKIKISYVCECGRTILVPWNIPKHLKTQYHFKNIKENKENIPLLE